ncbi:MAG: PAS domain S-box protein [Methanomicrobiaceae archaeon]|nr:PAS domain S-box protein [Methanomicrobiaceae archaeon]
MGVASGFGLFNRHTVIDHLILVIIFFTILFAEASVYILSGGASFVLAHLLYFPVLFVAYAFPRRGVLLSTLIGFSYIILSYAVFYPAMVELIPATMQFYAYVSIGVAASYISSELKMNELKYRNIFANSGSGISLVNLKNHRILESNAQCPPAMQHDRDGHLIDEIWQDAAECGEFFALLEDRGTIRDYELRTMQADGTHQDLLISAGVLPGDSAVFTITDITGRKEELDSLRRTEQRFRELTDSLPHPVFEFDRSFRVNYANRTARETFLFTLEDVAEGIGVEETVAPEWREQARLYLKRALQEGASEPAEYTAIRKDGTVFPALVFTRPIIRDNQIAGIRGSIIDITDRKRAEARQQENIRNLEFLSGSATDFVDFPAELDLYQYICDRLAEIVPGSISFISKVDLSHAKVTVQACCLSDAQREVFTRDLEGDMVGLSFTVPPEVAEQMKAGTLVEIPGGLRGASFGFSPDEQCRRIEQECSLGRMFGTGFNWQNNLFACATLMLPEGSDLDHRDLVEAFLHQATVALRRRYTENDLQESEAKYRTVFESSSDAIILLTERVIDCNEQIERLFGYTKEEIIGISPIDFSPEKQPDGRESVDAARELIHAAMAGEAQSFPWRFTHRDGTPIYTETLLKPIMLHGEVVLLATVHDVTERMRSEEALRDANRKLGLLSSITRHDILNQVTAARLYYEMLTDPSFEPADRDHALSRIRTAIYNIQDIVEFARIYEKIGVKEPRWQEVGYTGLQAAVAFDAGRIAIHVDAGNLEIFADPLLEKVFFNLFDNAVRHGEAVSEITVTFRPNGSDAVIVVEDDGPGVPVDQKEEIFRKGVGKNTGKGLFLSREILAITGIAMYETGVEGEGARFELHIPEGKWRAGKSRGTGACTAIDPRSGRIRGGRPVTDE